MELSTLIELTPVELYNTLVNRIGGSRAMLKVHPGDGSHILYRPHGGAGRRTLAQVLEGAENSGDFVLFGTTAGSFHIGAVYANGQYVTPGNLTDSALQEYFSQFAFHILGNAAKRYNTQEPLTPRTQG